MSARLAFKMFFASVGCAAGLAAIAYLAALFYFLANRVLPDAVAWDTWWRYWKVYGTDTVQRPRLIGSAMVAIAAVCVGFAWLAAQHRAHRRALHGSARWATDSEIRKAGLL